MKPGAIAAAAILLAACGPLGEGALHAKGEPVSPQVVAARGSLAESEQASIAIFRAVSPSVVSVIAGTPASAFNEEQVAAGTGFVWDRQGHIVTNNHVVAGAARVLVRPPGGGEDVPARVIGTAPNYDLAVLQIERALDAPPLAIGTSHDLQIGQATFAIGNPFGFDQTFTSGMVSAIGRQLPTE